MAKPGYPTQTYYPYTGWFFYRTGATTAYKKSRAHFAVSWGIFDPNTGTYPSSFLSRAISIMSGTYHSILGG